MERKTHEKLAQAETARENREGSSKAGPETEGEYESLEILPVGPTEEERKALAEARAEIEAVKAVSAGSYRHDLYGSFASEERRPDGKIVLKQEAAAAAERGAAEFRRSAKYMTNTVVGEPIAAEYDIRTRNFSTQTRILTLPDGRKVFAVYDHRGSWLHRGLDGLMKRLNGLKMRKASRAEWKAQFEAKSTIPVIENDDPDTVLMPFHSNVNGHDLFARNAEIENFGSNTWAKEVDFEAKLDFAASIADEIKRVHEAGTAWGELILPNVIFSEERKPIICDPEVRYHADVPLPEAKARDLKDLCLSVASALEHAHGESDYGHAVRVILGRYGDSEVIAEVKRLASAKRGIVQNLFFGYEKARTGVSGKKQYDAILKVIAEYEDASQA